MRQESQVRGEQFNSAPAVCLGHTLGAPPGAEGGWEAG